MRFAPIVPTDDRLRREAEDWHTAGKSSEELVAHQRHQVETAARDAGFVPLQGLQEQLEDLERTGDETDLAEERLQAELAGVPLEATGIAPPIMRLGVLCFTAVGEFVVLVMTFADYLGVDLARGPGSSPIKTSIAVGLAAVLSAVMFRLAHAAFSNDELNLDVGVREVSFWRRLPLRRLAAMGGLLACGLFAASARGQVGATGLFRLVSVLAFPVGTVALWRWVRVTSEHMAAFREFRSRRLRRAQVRRSIGECRRQRADVEREHARLSSLKLESERATDVFERLLETLGERAEVQFRLASRRAAERAPLPWLRPVPSSKTGRGAQTMNLGSLREAARSASVLDVLGFVPGAHERPSVGGDRGHGGGNGRSGRTRPRLHLGDQ